jgi:8-amino-7-oxononanoate synthase
VWDVTGEWLSAVATASAGIADRGQWRTIRTLSNGGVRTRLGDREVIQYASNDYLGLSQHQRVIAAAVEATSSGGVGSGASRLVVGARPLHEELEAELADWKRCESALLFPTGYAANLGVLGALGRLGEVGIVSDELNHASIIDGARLSRCAVSVFQHRDVDHAAAQVEEHRRAGRRCVVVTDTVFSMDGDLAPLADLDALCAATDTLLLLDDAHASLASARPGSATTMIVGTLSKTLGSLGGFVAGPDSLVKWCLNTSRSFIFSTAAPVGLIAAAREALAILRSEEGENLAAALARNIELLHPGHPTPIVPVIVGDASEAVRVSAALLEQSMLVPAIRPPTVPVGTSRLRVALSAEHSQEQVLALANALGRLGLGAGGAPGGDGHE